MIASGPGRSSSSSVGASSTGGPGGGGGLVGDMYERLVRAVLGRDKKASARLLAQETEERLLRVLHAQAQNLTVHTTVAQNVLDDRDLIACLGCVFIVVFSMCTVGHDGRNT